MEPAPAARTKSPWTIYLRFAFIALAAAGAWAATLLALMVAFLWWVIIAAVAIYNQQPSPDPVKTSVGLVSYLSIELGPGWMAVLVVAAGAAIGVTYGAIRLQAWAHWGATCLIALTVGIAWWLGAMPATIEERLYLNTYGFAGLCFVVAMLIAARRYGRWGMVKSTAPSSPNP